MSREQTSKQDQISIFGKIAKGFKTDHVRKHFSLIQSSSTSLVDEDIPKDLDDGFYVYANMKKLSETELDELKSLTWKEYPKNLKLFLFDYCILNGEAFSKYFHD